MRHLLENIRTKVEWWQTSGAPRPPLWLRLPARLFGLAARLRADLYRRAWLQARPLPCVAISIGNLTSGGTGKTPMTVCTAEIAADLGYRVAVISRGYGGSAGRRGGMVSDGRRLLLGPEAAGDEPYMMATRLAGIPVLVGHDRWRCGQLAIDRFRSQVIVLDDAFQHLALARDLDVVLLDHDRPFGNRWLLPAGPLREPVAALRRAHALVLTRTPSFDAPLAEDFWWATADRIPIFRSQHVPYLFVAGASGCGIPPRHLWRAATATVPPPHAGSRVVAFAGIARNDDFERVVRALGYRLETFIGFPDHHPYSAGDVEKIGRQMTHSGANILMTTEKDYARSAQWQRWPFPLVVAGVSLKFDPAGPAYRDFIATRLERLVSQKAMVL